MPNRIRSAGGKLPWADRLLCALGWHAVTGRQIWNNGICFGRCSRCRRDVVREEKGRWTVPAGYRIVWKTAVEAEADAALTVRKAAQARAGSKGGGSLPIQRVLDRLGHAAPAEAEAPPAPTREADPWVSELEARASALRNRVSLQRDFMGVRPPAPRTVPAAPSPAPVRAQAGGARALDERPQPSTGKTTHAPPLRG